MLGKVLMIEFFFIYLSDIAMCLIPTNIITIPKNNIDFLSSQVFLNQPLKLNMACTC